jgi:hypothetical protein
MKDQIAPLEITSDEKTMATLAHVLQLVGCLVRHNIFVRIFSRRKGSVGSSTFSSIFPRYLRCVDRYFQYYGTQSFLAIYFGIKAGRGEWASYPFVGRWGRHIVGA